MNQHHSFVSKSFDALCSYYAEKDHQNGVYRITAVGEFIPSSLKFVHNALGILQRSGLLDLSKPFLDAGCGDGRIVALTAFIHGIPSFGIEYDEAIQREALQHIETLMAILGPPRAPIKITAGDFCDSEVYTEMGVPFSQLATVFNYANNYTKIAKKMARDARSGTLFLLYYPSSVPEILAGLIWERTLVKNQHHLSESKCSVGPAIHVYRKP